MALLVVLGLGLGAVVVRLAQVQLLSAPREAAYGRSEVLHTVSLRAQRGSILDREGQALATSVPATTIDADPYQIKHPEAEAAQLAPVLHQPVASLAAKLSIRSGFVYLAKQLAPATGDKVAHLGLAGIYELSDPKRVDPVGSLMTQLVGLVGTGGNGLSGLEYQYNGLLGGHSGRETLEEDPEGGPIPGGVLDKTAARPGQGLVLTLDSALQYETEQALATEIVQAKAKGGTAIVTDPRTGDILSMVSLQASSNGGEPVPTSQPAALNDVYEPGSVMKLATMAGVLTDHVVTTNQQVTVPSDLLVGGKYFHDDVYHPTEELTPAQILSRSSNIGTIELAERLGKQRLYHWLRAFGFGRPTGLTFPGESAGLMAPPSHWSGTAIGAMPIGQDEAVTALQVLDAYNTIANDGTFVPPRLVRATIGADGERHPVAPHATRRVVSNKVAGEVTSMLEGVISRQGTAPKAAVPGYTVAGKTGTAQIPWPNRPGYQPGAYMATFVGFVPAEHPALSIIVDLDQPTPIYGGSVAAPVFAAIAEYALHTLGIPPASTTPAGAAPTQATVPFSVPTTTTTTTTPTTTTTTPTTTSTTATGPSTNSAPTTTTTTPTTTASTTTATSASPGNSPHPAQAATTDLRTKARPATLAASAGAAATA